MWVVIVRKSNKYPQPDDSKGDPIRPLKKKTKQNSVPSEQMLGSLKNLDYSTLCLRLDYSDKDCSGMDYQRLADLEHADEGRPAGGWPTLGSVADIYAAWTDQADRMLVGLSITSRDQPLILSSG